MISFRIKALFQKLVICKNLKGEIFNFFSQVNYNFLNILKCVDHRVPIIKEIIHVRHGFPFHPSFLWIFQELHHYSISSICSRTSQLLGSIENKEIRGHIGIKSIILKITTRVQATERLETSLKLVSHRTHGLYGWPPV